MLSLAQGGREQSVQSAVPSPGAVLQWGLRRQPGQEGDLLFLAGMLGWEVGG